MRAVRMIDSRQPLQMQEVPVPEPGNREVLIRIRAAGICHSDAHYRAGKSPVEPLPLTLGHEIAGRVAKTGPGATAVNVGDRVCLHYLLSCGDCYHCSTGSEQFCRQGSMLGHFSDGGYAEYIVVPERNAVRLPDEISFAHGAVLMCASATSLHALRKARFKAGETVAIWGAGGLGMSAIQLALALGALDVYAVDIHTEKLELARSFGAVPVAGGEYDPVDRIRQLTAGKGADVALELIGLPETIHQAIRVLGVMGRVAIVGIGDRPVAVDTYRELIANEAEIIGSNDHLLQELPLLLELARRGKLDLSRVATRTVPLDADAINQVLDDLEQYQGAARTVIVP
jgi:2-desacetyl-2-hydroxyethyl bacteriochlorophyllide A dehydrogenase